MQLNIYCSEKLSFIYIDWKNLLKCQKMFYFFKLCIYKEIQQTTFIKTKNTKLHRKN